MSEQYLIAKALCDAAPPREIANQEEAPFFDDSNAHVQRYWLALAREAMEALSDIDSIGSHIGDGGEFDPDKTLKPCPCCGAPGYLIAGARAYKIKCTGCELQTRSSEYRADVIALWNHRTPKDDWNPINTVPYGTPVQVKVGHMIFLARLECGVSETSRGDACDQWQAVYDGEHPPCWSGGACWASNADGDASLQPTGWRGKPRP